MITARFACLQGDLRGIPGADAPFKFEIDFAGKKEASNH
jgi:hypothetical protein